MFNVVRWRFFGFNGVLWIQCGSLRFFEVHLGSVRFNEVLWFLGGSLASIWFAEVQSASQGFFEVHLCSVRFNGDLVG